MCEGNSPPSVDEHEVSGDLTIVYPKPYSIYLEGAIAASQNYWSLGVCLYIGREYIGIELTLPAPNPRPIVGLVFRAVVKKAHWPHWVLHTSL